MIKGGPFAGIAPKYATHLLPDNAAKTAKNCVMTSGELRPLKAPSFAWTPTKVGTIKTIWRYKELYWFHWLEDVNVVASPLANDAYERVYWTGEAQPRMTTNAIATSGGETDYPNNYYVLGIPAPAAVATITHGDPSNANNIQSRAYIYTYVSAYGEEGPPSLTSDLHDITDGDSVTVGLPSTGPTGSYNITHKNIYRLNSGIYQFVATVTVATTSYADTKLNSALGSEITSTEYDPPPAGLKGLLAMANGSLAGFSGNELCMSVPYLPHAWPARYRIPFVGAIVSIGAFGNSILVTTTHDKPCVLSGDDPAAMFKEQSEVGQGCMSKRGTVDMGNFVVYPAPTGLIVVGTGAMDLITKDVVDPRDWVSYAQPSTFLGAKWGDNYLYFNTVGAVNAGSIFNTKTGDLSTMDLYATAAYTDNGTGDLYLVVSGDIVKFDGGAALTMEWESKDFILGKETNFGRAKVRAASFPLTLAVYADGALKHTQTVASKNHFSLPSGFLADTWAYKITAAVAVKSVSIGNSIGEL